MLSIEDHIRNLVRHINLVREACLLLGTRLIATGKREFGRILISKGFIHDASKFHGIEWDYLHSGRDIPREKLDLAIKQHVMTNPHHPEYWGGVENMPDIFLAEMVCDWYGRSQEFGTSLRDWIVETAVEKFKIASDDLVRINGYVDLLLQDEFVRS